MNNTIEGYVYLVIGLLTGALLPVVLVFATNLNIFEFLVLAYLLTVPFSYVFVLMSGKRNILSSYLHDRGQISVIVLLGTLLYVPSSFILLYSEHFISAALATVVYRTWPLLMLPFLPWILKEKLTRNQVIALTFAFLGIYIAITNGTFALSLSNANVGVLLFVALGALSYAVGSALVKRYSVDISSSIFIFSSFLLAGFALILTIDHGGVIMPNLGDLIAILYLGIAVNIVGFSAYFAAIRRLKTTIATNIYFLSPFLTFVFASVILGETIRPYYLLVAVLVTVGLVIQKLDKRGGQYVSETLLPIYDITPAFLSNETSNFRDVLERGGKVLALKTDRNPNLIAKVLSEFDEKLYIGIDEFGTATRLSISRLVYLGPDETLILLAGKIREAENVLQRVFGRLYAQVKED